MSGFMKYFFWQEQDCFISDLIKCETDVIEQGKETRGNFLFFHPLFCQIVVLENYYIISTLQTFLMVYKELNIVELVALVRILREKKHTFNIIILQKIKIIQRQQQILSWGIICQKAIFFRVL